MPNGPGQGHEDLGEPEIYTILEGTSEIQALVIARTISGAPIR